MRCCCCLLWMRKWRRLSWRGELKLCLHLTSLKSRATGEIIVSYLELLKAGARAFLPRAPSDHSPCVSNSSNSSSSSSTPSCGKRSAGGCPAAPVELCCCACCDVEAMIACLCVEVVAREAACRRRGLRYWSFARALSFACIGKVALIFLLVCCFYYVPSFPFGSISMLKGQEGVGCRGGARRRRVCLGLFLT
jgi:hypothetical protein